MAYTPPSSLNFNFLSTYTPATTPLTLNFAPASEIFPSSIDESAFGAHVVYTTQFVLPTGFVSSSFGTTLIKYDGREISVGGIAPLPQTGPQAARQLPTPTIDFRRRFLEPTSFTTPAIPTHSVTHYTQYVDIAGRGVHEETVAEPFVAMRVREVTVPFIFGLSFGTALVARNYTVLPSGFESSVVSTGHELAINLQRINTVGSVDSRFGDVVARNIFERIRPLSINDSEVMFHVVYNLRQIILQSPYMDTNSETTTWPAYAPYVENRNRIVAVQGFTSSRFSVIGNVVRNNAEAVVPSGLDATLWGPETFISHLHREVLPQPWTEFYASNYTTLHNAARVILPTGFRHAASGTPAILNLNRTFRHYAPYAGEVFGDAFISDAIRYVTPAEFRDPVQGIPEVRFNPYPIAPAAIPVPQFGGHYVEERFTIVDPLSANVHNPEWIGEPSVANRNKTIGVYPRDLLEMGRVTVFNYTTYVPIGAGLLTVWGLTSISYRTKVLSVFAPTVPAFPHLHQVRNLIPDPPGPQSIAPDSVIVGSNQVSPPIVSSNTIEVEGFTGILFGVPTFTRNTIAPIRGIFNLDQVGTPSIIATQYLYPSPVPYPTTGAGGSSDENKSKPRLSPYTIYAPRSDQATQQAINNHGGNDGELIDNGLRNSISEGGGWPFFGYPDVANRLRGIGPIGVYVFSDPVYLTNPTIELFNRYVSPAGIRPARFGFTTVGGGTQFIDLDSFGIDLPYFGDAPVVAYPPGEGPEPIIFAGGHAAGSFGTTDIMLFNREITPQGIPHRGNPEDNLTNPWGQALVGYPRVFVIGAGILTLWGTARVEHKIRTLFAMGHDSCSLRSYDIGSFNDRMQVSRRNPTGGLLGIPSAAVVGVPDVSHGIRTIYARGPDGYVSGVVTIRSASLLSPSGWDSLEVGDIDRWESDKIKPYGSELSELGTPRMVHTIRPSGLDDGNTGASRMAFNASVLGIPPIGFDGPSVTDMYGCNNRVVTPLPVLPENFPSPTVH